MEDFDTKSPWLLHFERIMFIRINCTSTLRNVVENYLETVTDHDNKIHLFVCICMATVVKRKVDKISCHSVD